MKPTIVSGNTPVDAWKSGAQSILKAHELTNLLTTIEDPCALHSSWLKDYSPHRVDARYDNIRDVVNTIFPLAIAGRVPQRTDLYTQYLAAHDRASRRRNGNAWGTYFERLSRFPPDGVNQLERVIDKLRNWTKRSKTGLVFHLSSPAVDTPRTRGGPCWQYGEIVWEADDVLHLVVVYRNHDFLNKVLGNFIGLGQLLKFMCDESGKEPGQLLCHSVNAFCGGNKAHLRDLSS